MRILIADNNLQHRISLSEELIKAGHKVIEVFNDQNVLKICKDKCPDLLFIDCKLGEGSGIDLVYQIRQLGGSSVWNIIVLMAENITKEDLQRGLEVGADDFLLKPIDNFKLLYKLSTVKRNQDLKNDIFEMAHDLALAHRALENVNKQDVMTGIYDVNTFYRILETEWFKAKKQKYTLGLILLNLDYFRFYNEIYGAELGDEKIKQIAKELQKKLPDNYKIIARTAGETFAVLLPQITNEFALNIANNLIKVVADLKISHKGSASSEFLTASAGVALSNLELNNFLELLESADFALYKAKHTGKGKVCLEQANLTDLTNFDNN